jgi:hypothetical protein
LRAARYQRPFLDKFAFDDPTLFYGRPLILFGRVAWAHDWANNPSLSAVFESL